MKAIEPAVNTQRIVTSEGASPEPKVTRRLTHVVRQVTEIERYCIGCGTCALVCPTDAIFPEYNFQHKFYHFKNKGGIPYMRGGRRNDPSVSTLDKLKFTRISMLTDPALDAGQARVPHQDASGQEPSGGAAADQGRRATSSCMIEGSFIPPVREIYPIRIGSMSIGALSPHMWEGLAMGITYLNEVEGLPVVMCSGEGGMPPSILKSRYLKYFILQIASGYFGWDEIIRALPDMIEDPCAIEIKYGQGAKPGDGGLLQAYKVLGLICEDPRRTAVHRSGLAADAPDQIFH